MHLWKSLSKLACKYYATVISLDTKLEKKCDIWWFMFTVIKSLTLWRCGSNFHDMIVKLFIKEGRLGALTVQFHLRWMPHNIIHERSTLLQVMDWCCQASIDARGLWLRQMVLPWYVILVIHEISILILHDIGVWLYICVNPFGAEVKIFLGNKVGITSLDVLAVCVTRISAAVVLSIPTK